MITVEQRHHLRRVGSGWVPKVAFARDEAWDLALHEQGGAVAYECCVCSAWHVGHMAPEGAEVRRQRELVRRAEPSKAAVKAAAVRERRRVAAQGSARSRRAAAEAHRRRTMAVRVQEGRWLDDGGALHAGVDHER